ncbi:MAG: hypothetical protein ACW981_01885 [Candidatus Hodarchaeales archaeon]
MKASNIIKFPDKSWTQISHQYNDLISQANHYIDDKLGDKSLAIELLFELVWGTTDYLKFEASNLLKTNTMIKDHPIIKSYLNQLLNLITVIEEISLINPSLAGDRYVLYYKDVIGTFSYIGVDPLPFICDVIISVNNLSGIKYGSSLYINEFCNFLTEIGILAYETTTVSIAQKILELGVKIIDKIGKYSSFEVIKVYIALGIIYENQKLFKKAACAYKETFKVITELNNNFNDLVIDQHIIHEIGIFGYLSSILIPDQELINDFFEFRSKIFSPEEAALIGDLHANYMLGLTDTTRIPYIGNQFDNYRSSIPSYILSGTSNRLFHLSSVSYISDLTRIIRQSVDKPYGIVVFEANSYKDIDIQIGKDHLPSKQIISKENGENIVDVLGKQINVSSSFCWTSIFTKNTEAFIQYQKKTYKRKLILNETPPTIIKINITKEIEETSKIKEGKAVRFYDELWYKKMSIIDIMKVISKISSDMFFFEEMDNFAQVFKKIGQKQVHDLVKDLTGKESIPLEGQALQLVILQRLSELTENGDEALKILSSLVNK